MWPSAAPALRVETLLVNEGNVLGGRRLREERAAVAELGFDYPEGATREPAERSGGRATCSRAWAPLELACLDEISVPPGVAADYLMRADGNVHALCSFTAYAVPQLRALGWRVESRPTTRTRWSPRDAPWYAHVGRRRAGPDGSTSSSASRSTAGG